MSFCNLPQEIIIIILNYLDTPAIFNLYSSCTYMRHIITSYNVVKECNFSLSTLASREILVTNFFKENVHHLYSLNLSGVADLTKTTLLPALKKLKNLVSLNVSYTRISLNDVVGINESCDTIKDLVINFSANKPKVLPKILLQLKNIFSKFENVHFVGSYQNLLYSGLAPYLLKSSNLNSLTFTITERMGPTLRFHPDEHNIKFNQFSLYLLNWKDDSIFRFYISIHLATIYFLDLKNSEYLIITVCNINEFRVYSSQTFNTFFKDNFGIDTKPYIEQVEVFDNGATSVLMLWNKLTKFDAEFYSNLRRKLQKYFNSFVNVTNNDTDRRVRDNWSVVLLNQREIDANNTLQRTRDEPEIKKRRTVENFLLDYDELLKDKDNIKLRIHSEYFRNPVCLSSESNYLSKLTHVSLTGQILYGSQFFNILLSNCNNLITLNVEALSCSPTALLISNCIPSSKSLQNLRIIDKRINFNTLFIALSKCKTLENIIIQDESTDCINLTDPGVIFANCRNLYYFYVYAMMSDNAKQGLLKQYEKAKTKYGIKYLYAQFLNRKDDIKYTHDPYIDVFNLSPIKLQF